MALVGAAVVVVSWTPGLGIPLAMGLTPATQRVSVDSSGVQGETTSDQPIVSADGRYVAFVGYGSNLVAGDTNNSADAFVRDTVAGTTERVSVSTAGDEGDANVQQVSLSPDGRYVVFASYASNLVAGDTNGVSDIFVRDRTLGTTERVSVDSTGLEANSDSDVPAIGADGRFVVFESLATNLVPGDGTGNNFDVFVHDRATGVTERVSVSTSGGDPNGGSRGPTVSADGRYVAYFSDAPNLVPGDTNGYTDVFVRDRQAGATILASVDSSGQPLNKGGTASLRIGMTPDGAVVTFNSESPELLGAAYGPQAIVRDLVAGTTEVVSVNPAGEIANAYSSDPVPSDDGRFVAFWSNASDLVPGDTNGSYDVFVRDRLTATTTRASVTASGAEVHGYSYRQSISANGGFVAFLSTAADVVPDDTNGTDDVFLRDLSGPSTPPPDSAVGTVPGGGTVTTGTGPASPADPVETSVTPFLGGNVSIAESSTIGTPPPVGYAFLGQEVTISAPPGGPTQPIRIVFTADASILGGTDAATLQVFRNGAVVAPCSPNDGTATPTPCVTARETLGDGDVQITVLTSQASVWNLGRRLPYTFTGFFSPVDNQPTANKVAAGSAVPVKFRLGGPQGLAIFAGGYPRSQSVACNAAATVDGIEQTVSANTSGLTYDAASGTYSYTWKTDKAWANTCRQLVLRFADGTYRRADFTFKK
jgi:Tol biopolymer transport system component